MTGDPWGHVRRMPGVGPQSPLLSQPHGADAALLVEDCPGGEWRGEKSGLASRFQRVFPNRQEQETLREEVDTMLATTQDHLSGRVRPVVQAARAAPTSLGTPLPLPPAISLDLSKAEGHRGADCIFPRSLQLCAVVPETWIQPDVENGVVSLQLSRGSKLGAGSRTPGV